MRVTGKNNKEDTRIRQLEDKVEKLKHTLSSYRSKVKEAGFVSKERDLYRDLFHVLGTAESFDAFLKSVFKIVAKHTEAFYYGFFGYNPVAKVFVYKYGQKYSREKFPEIGASDGVMPEVLFENDVRWIPRVSEDTRYDVLDLNQKPAEYNLLCIPVVLRDKSIGVLRFANLSPDLIDAQLNVLKRIHGVINAGLERVLLFDEKKKSSKSIKAGFEIASLLENTLSERQILKKVCAQIPRLINCRVVVVAVKDGKGIYRSAGVYPEFFSFGEGKESIHLYAGNIEAAFSDGNGLVRDVNMNKKWALPDKSIKSMVSAGIHKNRKLWGIIIAFGDRAEEYDSMQSNLLAMIASQTAVTLERAAYFRKQENLARRDGLTSLLNHRVFQETVRSEIDRVRRYRRTLSMIILDIDHFKKFNDTYGHPVGDEVIKMVASALLETVRESDTPFRYGGEEFCILLPETNSSNAVVLAERLRHEISNRRCGDGLSVTVSLGVTEYKPPEKPEDFIDRADNGLYEAKEGGRNRAVVMD